MASRKETMSFYDLKVSEHILTRSLYVYRLLPREKRISALRPTKG